MSYWRLIVIDETGRDVGANWHDPLQGTINAFYRIDWVKSRKLQSGCPTQRKRFEPNTSQGPTSSFNGPLTHPLTHMSKVQQDLQRIGQGVPSNAEYNSIQGSFPGARQEKICGGPLLYLANWEEVKGKKKRICWYCSRILRNENIADYKLKRRCNTTNVLRHATFP
jgi:hypothetical protein